MKTNVIRHRVADFLKSHAPFDTIPEPDLLELAGSGRVRFHETDEYLYRQGDSHGQFLLMIQQGRVDLLESSDRGEQLHDVLGEGDLLGLDRFAADGRCLYSARTASDVIVYGLSAAMFESLSARYSSVRHFLAAQFAVAANLGSARSSWLDAPAPPVGFLRARLATLPAGASTAEAVSLLHNAPNRMVAMVDDSQAAIGTVSTAELCGAPHGALLPLARPAPPKLDSGSTTRAATLALLHSRREELAITIDGRLDALLTAADLALFCGHNPVALVSQMLSASSLAELAPLLGLANNTVLDALAKPSDVDDCCQIAAEIISAATEACIRQASTRVQQSGIDIPETPFCWLLFGSGARGEVLVPPLSAIAAVYDDSSAPNHSRDAAYFKAVVEETMSWLRACGLTEAGFEWPLGSHPSMPLSEWRRFFIETLNDPLGHDFYGRRELFDVLPLGGTAAILESLLTDMTVDPRDHQLAVLLFANDTLAHLPPLTFFRGLVMGLDGAQHETFDIRRTMIDPIAGVARVCAIAKGRLSTSNTLARLATAETDFPDHAAIFRDAAGALRTALYYQALSGASQIDAGKLGRVDQRSLKTAFTAIQRLLEFTAATWVDAA